MHANVFILQFFSVSLQTFYKSFFDPNYYKSIYETKKNVLEGSCR